MENGLDNKAIKVFTQQELKEKFENQLDNTGAIINETIADKKLLPFEEPTKNTEEDSLSEIAKNNNLLFEEKEVSFVKLCLHLSGKCEIILMILGTICALGSGVAAH